jgi:hypothetical protein
MEEISAGFLFLHSGPGMPDFSWEVIPKPEKMYQMNTKVPNGHKISQMSVNYSKWQLNISTFSKLGSSKIYQNWDFWLEKNPSGTPVQAF